MDAVSQLIVDCEGCPRLREHCRRVAREKRRAYRHQQYWGRPVPGFGDPAARLLIVGLAPGAHGANRTGRMFTGDSSGDLLYATLHATGFATQAESVSRDDGLQLRDAYITAAARCAPPDNKPAREELQQCSCFLEREMLLLPHIRVVVALGRVALDALLRIWTARGEAVSRREFAFGHGAEHALPSGSGSLLCSFHPSRQNTQTGRLSEPMFRGVFERARALLEASPQLAP
ncbi:MAG: uracil-DNA glycosylase [Acidobacteria bacterium]|nr:uracil-DNA glycosylase [Acidobacteriota bacterium]